ncbi:MAG: c-type cytochrome [Variibacter sp.]
MQRVLTCSVALMSWALAVAPAFAQLRGHGGPVRALAISADAQTALSGSFDSSAIRWSLRRNAAEQVLRFHDGAVNAVAMLQDGRLATAGEDGRVALWTPGKQAPDRVLEGHQGPVVALAVSPDGTTLASASWDHTLRLWPLAGGAPRILEGHQQNVNGVAFTPDGAALVSAGYDATVRIWPLQGAAAPRIVTLSAPLNAVVVAPDGEIIAAGADGSVSFLSPRGEQRDKISVAQTPIIALAQARDGERLAAASIQGAIAVIERKERKVARVIVGPGLPVWSAVFLPDNRTLLTGGADAMIRRWDTQTGEPIGALPFDTANDPLAAYGNDPGARVYRACIACHTLHPDAGNRAGPTLHGIFGRRIASLPGYNFSKALKHLDIVWTPETVAKLFEVGPARYTPGTKMPEQHLGAADRDALIAFLKKATQ